VKPTGSSGPRDLRRIVLEVLAELTADDAEFRRKGARSWAKGGVTHPRKGRIPPARAVREPILPHSAGSSESRVGRHGDRLRGRGRRLRRRVAPASRFPDPASRQPCGTRRRCWPCSRHQDRRCDIGTSTAPRSTMGSGCRATAWIASSARSRSPSACALLEILDPVAFARAGRPAPTWRPNGWSAPSLVLVMTEGLASGRCTDAASGRTTGEARSSAPSFMSPERRRAPAGSGRAHRRYSLGALR
jgi:hypothetical protein